VSEDVDARVIAESVAREYGCVVHDFDTSNAWGSTAVTLRCGDRYGRLLLDSHTPYPFEYELRDLARKIRASAQLGNIPVVEVGGCCPYHVGVVNRVDREAWTYACRDGEHTLPDEFAEYSRRDGQYLIRWRSQ
jgi:hypothetical protein